MLCAGAGSGDHTSVRVWCVRARGVQWLALDVALQTLQQGRYMVRRFNIERRFIFPPDKLHVLDKL